MPIVFATIRPKRGPKNTMPTLQTGEIAITTDTFELFVGHTSGNKLVGENTFLKLSGGSLTGFLTLHADPTNDMHAATKRYVDSVAAGLKWKQPVRVATTTNITLSGLQTIDGVSLQVGDRVLVKDQTNPAQNGIYIVQSGSWIRASDADTWDELVSSAVFVMQGTANADKGFVCTSDPGGTLGTTAVTWVQFSGGIVYTFGNGLQLSGSTVSLKVDTDVFGFSADGTLTLNLVDGGTWV